MLALPCNNRSLPGIRRSLFTFGAIEFSKRDQKNTTLCGGGENLQRKVPCDVLLYMKIIRSLIKAAYVLKEKKKSPIKVSENNLFDKRYFRSHYQSANELEEFPRSLSIKEFCNPYRVFKKIFKYQPLDKWLHDWEECVECALSPASGELDLDMLEMYSCLAKLTEAAHLINVREVTHVGGILKNRFIEN